MMKNILITGSNRGIGLELTRQLLNQGNRVFGTCRLPVVADELNALARSFPKQLTVLPMDVTNDEMMAVAQTAVSTQVESLDMLINNAGIFIKEETLANFTPQTMQQTFNVNVIGAMRVATQFSDLLCRGTKPRIINISSQLASLAGMGTNSGSYSYNSSKTALNMVTRMLANDLKRDEIAVIAMDPGWVQTDMGGKGAPLLIPDAVQGMLTTIGNLTLENTGQFYTYSGEKRAW